MSFKVGGAVLLPIGSMNIFHEVELSGSQATGSLFLHSMPGRFEPMREFVAAMEAAEVDCLLCLVSDLEIREKSPNYLDALENDAFKKRVLRLPIEDYGVPEDLESVHGAMDHIAAALVSGRNALIHCAAGVGRTGTMAICLLAELGFDLGEATRRVMEAHSEPETDLQRGFIRCYFRRARGSDSSRTRA
jgi:protein-tyrosine phosphatase